MKIVSKIISEALSSLIEISSNEDKASFKKLAISAGLDPGTDFRGASLRGLDFRDEDLSGFDFSGADLTGSDFRRAKIKKAKFTGANLNGAIGFKKNQNSFPSTSINRAFAIREVKKSIINNLVPDAVLRDYVTDLRFGKTKIKNISKIAYVKNLRKLSLSGADIQSIDELSILSDLVSLNIDNTKVSDLSPLEACKSLQYLSANNTLIGSLIEIEKNNKLQYLSIRNTLVTSLQGLLNLKDLRHFNIKSIYIENISHIEYLTNMEFLIVDTPHVRELPKFTNMKKMQYLDIRTCSVSFPEISEMTMLTHLSVTSDKCVFIPNIGHLRNLKSIDLNLKNLHLPNKLVINEGVENITLSNVDLRLFSVHESIRSVKNINLNNVEIDDFNFLGNMRYIVYLNIRNIPQLCDLGSLPLLPNLEFISLEGENFSGLGKLNDMPNLKTIFVNSITTYENFKRLGSEINVKMIP